MSNYLDVFIIANNFMQEGKNIAFVGWNHNLINVIILIHLISK